MPWFYAADTAQCGRLAGGLFSIETHDLGLQVIGQVEGFLQPVHEVFATAQAGTRQRDTVLGDADIRPMVIGPRTSPCSRR